MKFIVPIAVIAIMLLQFSGAVPQSSVGGPLTLAVVFLGASLAVGIHDAWTNKRGVIGWIVSITVSVLGGFLAANFGDLFTMMLIAILGQLGTLNGSLAATGGPLLYLSLAGMMLLMLLGSWGALWIVNRWR